MSTRSNIALETSNGRIQNIYCHHDGYLEFNGRLLQENYTDVKAVKRLLKLGNLSALGESTHDCEAYCRDRGEPLFDNESTHWDHLKEWLYQNSEEFNYLFKKDRMSGGEYTWVCYDCRGMRVL